MKVLKNERGAGLALAIFLILLVSVIGISLLQTSAHSLKQVDDERTDQSVYYIAESGLNLAKADIIAKINEAYDEANEKAALVELSPSSDLYDFRNDFFEKVLNEKLKCQNNICEKYEIKRYNNGANTTSNISVNITDFKADEYYDFEIVSKGNIDNRSRTLKQRVRISLDGIQGGNENGGNVGGIGNNPNGNGNNEGGNGGQSGQNNNNNQDFTSVFENATVKIVKNLVMNGDIGSKILYGQQTIKYMGNDYKYSNGQYRHSNKVINNAVYDPNVKISSVDYSKYIKNSYDFSNKIYSSTKKIEIKNNTSIKFDLQEPLELNVTGNDVEVSIENLKSDLIIKGNGKLTLYLNNVTADKDIKIESERNDLVVVIRGNVNANNTITMNADLYMLNNNLSFNKGFIVYGNLYMQKGYIQANGSSYLYANKLVVSNNTESIFNRPICVKEGLDFYSLTLNSGGSINSDAVCTKVAEDDPRIEPVVVEKVINKGDLLVIEESIIEE